MHKARYRDSLPIPTGDFFVSDGGLETELIFKDHWDLPVNAAFVLLETDRGRRQLTEYFKRYLLIARSYNAGFILESPTWRASPRWIAKVGYPVEAVGRINRDAIAFLADFRERFGGRSTPIVISGCMGPRGDGYAVEEQMTVEEARRYHAAQIEAFGDTEADMVSAFTLNYVEEAIGIALAARDAQIPSVISFTIETDGTLPSGQTLGDAIDTVEEATDSAPAYYMINCAHPTHIFNALTPGGPWTERIRAIRANASRKSHAELETCDQLDQGNPVTFAHYYKELGNVLPYLNVFGGCCGTDHRHIEEICRSCLTANV